MSIFEEKIIEISSTANQKLKDIAKLVKDGKDRRRSGLLIVDGKREIEEALKSSWLIKEFFYCEEFDKDNSEIENFFAKAQRSYKLTNKAFEKISYKKNPDGYLAVFEEKFLKLKDVMLKKSPLVLVLESVEKPGNLGAIIRTAYASGVDLIILNDQKTDIYSPNVIRSSTGFIFSMPLVLSSAKETFLWLKKNDFKIFVTTLEGEKSHFEVDFKKASAIIFGTESFGISKDWKIKEVENIRIPMIKGVDSLNVSVSAGIVIYEALRQRRKIK
ncbi:rRNA methyltransferase [Candidatus Falkowbacteria bacterium HGW-Falkowbacteria-1]|jgi:TrmH family RNA methyltransferase|uniref:rRNA methyltransferase n=1 Tax=Candidatus Falkowbacteria bacterium HGW-Falkowbacteria-1 TaxID=2013768 RepID=A0A2N2E9V6_9BACT|nr:MAG: rRNA methyltransferase [Candidatus Falkowbacteria bacterium HGW-Falkowbacteria-1]